MIDNADDLRKNFEQKGFFDLGRPQSRVKGESSLRDKIVSYLKKHPNATHLDIWQEIRDCFACSNDCSGLLHFSNII